MNVIAGLWARSGDPLARRELDRLIAMHTRRSSFARVRHWHRASDGGCAIAVGVPGATTHGLARYADAADAPHITVAWDGQLHNAGDYATSPSPAAWVAWLYAKEGARGLSSLIGEFACAIWDVRERRLTLGRDLFGMRPLFYAVTDRWVCWSSDIRIPLSLPDVSLDIDEEFIAGFLAREAEPWRTPYRSVFAVPAGHVVVVTPSSVEVQRSATLEVGSELKLQSAAEYEERFRTLFWEAVRVRLQRREPICCELSGGIDSSSITCVAAQLLQRGETPATRLWTASFVFDTSPTADEQEFIREVTAATGMRSVYIHEEERPVLSRFSFPDAFGYPAVSRCFAGLYEQLAAAMQREDTSFVLTGAGGDQVVWGEVPNPLDLADLLRAFRLREFAQRWIAWSRDQRRPLGQLLWKAGIWPLLPRRWRRGGDPNNPVPTWYNQAFARRLDLADRMLGRSEAEEIPGLPPSKREQLASILEYVHGLSCRYLTHYEGGEWIEISYPFLHKPFVEFSLATPTTQHLTPGESRALMRRSMRGVLPERVRTRRRKKGPDEPLCRGIAREWTTLIDLVRDAHVVRRGYVEPDGLITALDRARYGQRIELGLICRALALEFWLRAREDWQTARMVRNDEQEGGECDEDSSDVQLAGSGGARPGRGIDVGR
jgi:asparagine synthase (glutamine-hydrolysing)